MTENQFAWAFQVFRDQAGKDPAFDVKVGELIMDLKREVAMDLICGAGRGTVPTERRAELFDRLNALLAEAGAPPVPP